MISLIAFYIKSKTSHSYQNSAKVKANMISLEFIIFTLLSYPTGTVSKKIYKV